MTLDRWFRARFQRTSCVVLGGTFIAAAVVLWLTPVWGLEYEDAFEYEYGARLLAGDGPLDGPAMTPLCLDGSARDCTTLESLPHPIGLSVAASFVSRAFPALRAVPLVSLVCFVLLGVALVHVMRGAGLHLLSVITAISLFIASPLAGFYGTGFAEPVAGCLLFVALTSAWLATRHGRRLSREWPSLVLIVASMSLAIVTKREALVGASLAAVVSTVAWARARSTGARHAAAALVGGLGAAIALSAGSIFAFGSASPMERWPFAISNLARFLPAFVQVLSQQPATLALAGLAVLGAPLARHRTAHLAGLAIVATQVIVFLAFDQDRHTQLTGSVPLHHLERYSVLVLPLLALLAASGMSAILDRVKRFDVRSHRAHYVAGTVGLAVVALGLSATVSRRAWLDDTEERVRLSSIRAACAELGASDVLVTDEPVVAGIICSPDQHVVDWSFSNSPEGVRRMQDYAATGRVVVVRNEVR